MRFVLPLLVLTACGPSAVLSVNTDRNSAQANGTEAITITATVKDASGAAKSGATVTFSVPSPGALSESSVTTDASGNAVTKLTSTAVGALVVTVSTEGAANDVKPSFTFTTPKAPNEPAALRFTQSPATTQLNNLLRPIPTVVVVDSGGMVVTSSTASITVRLTAGSCSGSLGSTSLFTVAARMGEASFNGLSAASAGTGCTLTADAAGLEPAVSTAFDLQ